MILAAASAGRTVVGVMDRISINANAEFDKLGPGRHAAGFRRLATD